MYAELTIFDSTSCDTGIIDKHPNFHVPLYINTYTIHIGQKLTCMCAIPIVVGLNSEFLNVMSFFGRLFLYYPVLSTCNHEFSQCLRYVNTDYVRIFI